MGMEEVKSKESDSSRRTRELSTIKFPYSDLGAAMELAKKIQSKAGLSCETAQLAAWMGHSATGGTFRSRFSAARMFGLIRIEHAGQVTLTDLGQEILNPYKANRAKATAFLKVDLFSKIYETHKGQLLPPNPALERMMVNLGVTPKQQERARQTFRKSAEVAEFIDSQSGTFIQPGFRSDSGPPPGAELPETDPAAEEKGKGGGDDGNLPPKIDPIILGLLNRLPKPGDVWPMDDRTLWLELLAGSFKLVYKESEQPSIN